MHGDESEDGKEIKIWTTHVGFCWFPVPLRCEFMHILPPIFPSDPLRTFVT